MFVLAEVVVLDGGIKIQMVDEVTDQISDEWSVCGPWYGNLSEPAYSPAIQVCVDAVVLQSAGHD